jgi:hypothetical protein
VKRIIFSSVALVFFAMVIAGGILQLQSGRVECGGETMREGDVCVSKSRYGKVSESNLEESKTSAKVGSIVGIVIGAVAVLIAAQNLKIGIRNRKTAKAGAAAGSPWPDAPPQQYAPQYPQEPRQGFPPQQQYSPQQYSPQPDPRVPVSPQQQYPPQQHQSAQYPPAQDPPQQQYYQPPQHQYYQQPGPRDPQA